MNERLQSLLAEARTWPPGLLASATVAMAAMFLAGHYEAPVMLFALLLGIAFAFLYEDGGRCVPGIEVAARTVLRIGVALLGVRLTIEQIAAFGWTPILLVVTVVVATIGVGLVLARVLGQDRQLGLLSGGAVAICGASAALALASVLPRNARLEADTVLVVIAVTTLSTIAMVVYPLVPLLLDLDDHAAGYFLGSTIHDVAQVVGAGYSVSEETGDVSTFVKLLRVAMLLPVVFVVLWYLRARRGAGGAGSGAALPWFLVAFAALVAINSAGWLSGDVQAMLSEASRACLVTAIAALGMKTSLRALLRVGPRPILLIVLETAILALLALGLIWALP